MSAVSLPINSADFKRRIVEFMRGASTEISVHDADLVPALAKQLPAGTVVYVAHTPNSTLDDVLRVSLEVEAAGLRASPHIVARRLVSERALRDALRELRDGGVEHILLIAGDREQPAGKFSSTLEVLDSGTITTAGFTAVGVAGHPEGHRAIGQAALWNALRQKQMFAERTSTRMHIVTQFGFNPAAVCEWQRHLTAHGITLPVHVGIAGPTPLPKLIKFALQCGVGASWATLVKNMSALSNLARPATSPDEMLVGILRDCVATGATRIVKPHFYAFGGAVATARWLRAVADGSFELEPHGNRFVLHA